MHEHPIELVGDSRKLDARLYGRRISRISASCLTFGAETHTHPGKLDFYLLQIVVSGSYTVRLGKDEATLRRGEAAVVSPGEDLSTWWSPDCAVLAYLIRTPDLEWHLSSLLGEALREPIRFELAMDVTVGPARELNVGLLRPMARMLNGANGLFDDPVQAVQVEDALMSALLLAQPHNHSAKLERKA